MIKKIILMINMVIILCLMLCMSVTGFNNKQDINTTRLLCNIINVKKESINKIEIEDLNTGIKASISNDKAVRDILYYLNASLVKEIRNSSKEVESRYRLQLKNNQNQMLTLEMGNGFQIGNVKYEIIKTYFSKEIVIRYMGDGEKKDDINSPSLFKEPPVLKVLSKAVEFESVRGSYEWTVPNGSGATSVISVNSKPYIDLIKNQKEIST